MFARFKQKGITDSSIDLVIMVVIMVGVKRGTVTFW